MAERTGTTSADALPPAVIRNLAEAVRPAFRPAFSRLGKELRAYLGRWGLFFLTYEQVVDRDGVMDALSRMPLRIARLVADTVAHHDWLALEVAIVESARAHDLVEVLGLDRWLDTRVDGAAMARLRAFNVRREAFARRLSVPVLLWLKPAQASALAAAAPDLWSWRAGVHRFVEEVVDASIDRTERPATSVTSGIDNRSVEERLSRIDELTTYLAEADATIEPRIFVALSEERANLLESIGEWKESLQIRETLRQVIDRLGNPLLKALNLGRIATILASQGRLDESLHIHIHEELPIYEELGDDHSKAVTMGEIADLLQQRGEFDEALRIRREDELPVYERMGDARAKAVTLGKIATILQRRGHLDESLRIRREDELPVYERLGDLRSKALTMGRIADLYEVRGELEEALRIRRDEELPVYRRLGDVRSVAVTSGQIADVLTVRGQLDEALRIRTEEELPTYRRLGDVHATAVTMGQIADILKSRGQFDDAIDMLTTDVIPVLERIGDVREGAVAYGRIADIREERGDHVEAQRIRREEELPVYERLGDVHACAVTLAKIAQGIQAEGRLEDALRLWVEEVVPLLTQIGNPQWLDLANERVARLHASIDTTSADAAG